MRPSPGTLHPLHCHPKPARRPSAPTPFRMGQNRPPPRGRPSGKSGHPGRGHSRVKTGQGAHRLGSVLGHASNQPLRGLARGYFAQASDRPHGAAHLPGPGQRPWLCGQVPERAPFCPASGAQAGTALSPHGMWPGRRGPGRFRQRHSHLSARRQTPQNARLSHRAQPLAQRLQRGRIPADHRGVHPLPGKRFRLFRRRAQGGGARQPQGRRRAGRLV